VAYGFAASAEREGQRVQADYQTYLGRPASAAEVGIWVNAFVGGVSNESVIAGFLGSQEYFADPAKGNGDPATWLTSAYWDALQRLPTSGEITAVLGG
jgi:hypothetical protein